MGSWNETCGVSNLSIRAGEEIVFIPVAQNPWHFSHLTGMKGLKKEETPVLFEGCSGVYGTDLWAPLSIPLFGKYNDYGTIEDISSSIDEINQFESVFKDCIPLDVGENSCHDVPTGKLGIDEILELIREGRAYRKWSSGHCIPTIAMGAVMVKKSVWDVILSSDLKKDSDEWMYDGDRTPSIDKTFKKLEKWSSVFSEENLIKKLSYGIEHSLSDILYNSFGRGPFRINVKDISEKGKFLKLLSEFEFFYTVLGHLRISLSPTIGSGSQSDNRKLWKKINTKINKIIENENKLDKENE